ncbi:MAG: ABC transporter permease [Thermoanaerobaculia bacterium]
MRRVDLPAGVTLLLALVAGALLAPWLSPADPSTQFDPVAGSNLAPGSERFEIVTTDGRRRLVRSVTITDRGVAVPGGSGVILIPAQSIRPTEAGQLVRERRFLLGTDRFGRDLLTRMLHASRVSLLVAFLAAALASALGVVVGSAAAIGGPIAGGLLMRVTDAFVAFPSLFLLLALTSILNAGPVTVVLVLGATSWMTVSRLVRAELLRLKATEMALAATASGSGRIRKLWSHLLPNAMAPVLVATTLRIGDVLLLEAALSFLGFGIRPPAPSWGNMIADGAPDLATAWWTSTLPGIAIVVTVIAFNMVGDGLQARLRGRRAAG